MRVSSEDGRGQSPYVSARLLVDLTGSGVDPEHLTREFGIQPTYAIREGEPSSFGAPRTARLTSWVLRVEDRAATDIESAVTDLLKRIMPAQLPIRGATERFRTWITVTVSPETVLPLLVLSAKTLDDVASLGVSFEVDILADLVSRDGPPE
jgi:hypothetical protein